MKTFVPPLNENATIIQQLAIKDHSDAVHSFLYDIFLNGTEVHFLSFGLGK